MASLSILLMLFAVLASVEASNLLQRLCEPGLYCPGNRGCLELTKVCNGERDCPGGQDEDACQEKTCADDMVRCANKKECIPEASVCDAKPDCSDESDEKVCHVILDKGVEEKFKKISQREFVTKTLNDKEMLLEKSAFNFQWSFVFLSLPVIHLLPF